MGSEDQLRIQNAELAAREERHRAELQRQLGLSKRLREYATHMRAMLRERTLGGTGDVFAEVTGVSAEALGVERVSLWLFDLPRGVLVCKHLCVGGVGERGDTELPLAELTCYLRALRKDLIASDDLATDPRMIELREYAAERGIGALLDVPIIVDGEVLGVICHEHVGGPRAWRDAEIDFAANLGSLVALAMEVERRHEAQDRAHEAVARYRHLVETLPVVIYAIDAPTGRLAYVSPTIEALVGHTAEDWVAGGMDGWIAAIADEDRPALAMRLGIGPGGTAEPELIYRMRRGDGGVIWLRDLRIVVRGPTGEPLALQGVLEDITAERSADRRRREAERRYRELLDQLDLIGVVLDARGAVIAVNAAFAHTAGVSPEAVVGADFVERFVPEAERARVRQLVGDGIRRRSLPVRFECSLVVAASAPRSVWWTATLQLDEDGAISGVTGIGIDLTERLAAEAELAQQRKFESLGRMAAGVAHDFNNVLTVISLALAHGAKEGEIQSAMAYARELVASLLAYARREPVEVQDIDVDAAIGEVAPVLAAAIGKDLRFELNLGCDGQRVRIAPTELRQLVVNMVTNAGEATRGHGQLVRVTSAAFADEAAGAGVELRVIDDGRGMDEATRARVFDPFFTTKRPGEGTGIGLATCQSIVTRAGGTVAVESKPGVGTVFRIVLPAAPGQADAAVNGTGVAAASAATTVSVPAAMAGVAAAVAGVPAAAAGVPAVVAGVPAVVAGAPAVAAGVPAGAAGVPAVEAAEAAHSAARFNEKRVLLVEDSQAIGDLMMHVLRIAGYDVLHVTRVAKALAAIEAERFGVVIADLQLPDGRGEEIVEAARARSQRTAIIIASGEVTVINGVDGVLLKPFSNDDLRTGVRRALEHRREVQ